LLGGFPLSLTVLTRALPRPPPPLAGRVLPVSHGLDPGAATAAASAGRVPPVSHGLDPGRPAEQLGRSAGVFQSPYLAAQSRGPAEKPVLDTLFRTSAPLPQVLQGSFVRVPRADLLEGYLIAEVSTPEPSLFRVSSVYPDVIIKSMQDNQVVGRLVTVASCWVATARGLSVISPRLSQSSYEPLVPAVERVAFPPSVGFSIMDLFQSAGSLAPSSTAVVPSASPRLSHGTTPRGVVALPRGPASSGVGVPTWTPSSDTLQTGC
jgi:hypothetical protein